MPCVIRLACTSGTGGQLSIVSLCKNLRKSIRNNIELLGQIRKMTSLCAFSSYRLTSGLFTWLQNLITLFSKVCLVLRVHFLVLLSALQVIFQSNGNVSLLLEAAKRRRSQHNLGHAHFLFALHDPLNQPPSRGIFVVCWCGTIKSWYEFCQTSVWTLQHAKYYEIRL